MLLRSRATDAPMLGPCQGNPCRPCERQRAGRQWCSLMRSTRWAGECTVSERERERERQALRATESRQAMVLIDEVDKMGRGMHGERERECVCVCEAGPASDRER